MDIEKLIVSLRSPSWQDLEDPDATLLDDAATALSTLQAENERLKSLLGESGQDLWSKENQRADRLEAENEKLRAELEQARESLDFARTKDAEIVRLGMELEQVKRERDAAIRDLKMVAVCDTCVHEHAPSCPGCNDAENWQWRGPEEG